MITSVPGSNITAKPYAGANVRVDSEPALKQTERSTDAQGQQSAVVSISAQAATQAKKPGTSGGRSTAGDAGHDGGKRPEKAAEQNDNLAKATAPPLPVTAYDLADADQDRVVSARERHDYELLHPTPDDSKNQALLKTYTEVARAGNEA